MSGNPPADRAQADRARANNSPTKDSPTKEAPTTNGPAGDDPFAVAGLALAAAVGIALGPYLADLIATRTPAAIQDATTGFDEASAVAVRVAVERVTVRLGALVSADIDAQSTTPLQVVRGFVPAITDFLEALGVPPVARDRFKQERFPSDRFDLTPVNLAVLGDEVAELAIVWGATKAYEHRRRHGDARSR